MILHILSYPLIYPITHPLIHPITYLLIHLIRHLLIHPITPSLIHPLICKITPSTTPYPLPPSHLTLTPSPLITYEQEETTGLGAWQTVSVRVVNEAEEAIEREALAAAAARAGDPPGPATVYIIPTIVYCVLELSYCCCCHYHC